MLFKKSTPELLVKKETGKYLFLFGAEGGTCAFGGAPRQTIINRLVDCLAFLLFLLYEVNNFLPKISPPSSPTYFRNIQKVPLVLLEVLFGAEGGT